MLANAFSLSGAAGGSATSSSPYPLPPAGLWLSLTSNVDSLASLASPSTLTSILDQDASLFSAAVKEPMKPVLVNLRTDAGKFLGALGMTAIYAWS